MKDIMTKNSKGGLHSYQEYYYFDRVSSRFNCKNGKVIGYGEFHGVRTIIFFII